MRLWHQSLISNLPRAQLLGQHREICALRGMGWNRKHSVVNYVFNYPYSYLYYFHLIVISEMISRGYRVCELWYDISYRGKNIGYDFSLFTKDIRPNNILIYKEHDDLYLNECLDNLRSKNIIIKEKDIRKL